MRAVDPDADGVVEICIDVFVVLIRAEGELQRHAVSGRHERDDKGRGVERRQAADRREICIGARAGCIGNVARGGVVRVGAHDRCHVTGREYDACVIAQPFPGVALTAGERSRLLVLADIGRTDDGDAGARNILGKRRRRSRRTVEFRYGDRRHQMLPIDCVDRFNVDRADRKLEVPVAAQSDMSSVIRGRGDVGPRCLGERGDERFALSALRHVAAVEQDVRIGGQ